jgi:hypothetical protein
MTDGLFERYRRDGYVVIEDLIAPREVTELRDEAARLCVEKGPALSGASDMTQGEAGEFHSSARDRTHN